MKKTIPNSFTMGNLFCGFFAIIISSNHELYSNVNIAVLFIIIAMILDALDGRLARMLHVEGNFGKELDSLADIVTFGVAPAVIIYNLALNQFGIIGILISGLFPICGALRLARFNVSSNQKFHFIGLPITAAGGILILYSLSIEDIPNLFFLIITIVLSLLMVSNLYYPSFKHSKHKTILFILILLTISIILGILHIALVPYLLTILLIVYSSFGIVNLYNKKKYTTSKSD